MPTTTEDSAVRLKYEPEYDLLSAWIGAPQVADSVEVEPGFCLRVSRADHRVVGVEVVSASKRFQKDARTIQTPAFVLALIERYSPSVALRA